MNSSFYTNEIVLIRGLPGTGKSTMARRMKGYLHLEADMYLEVNGTYLYDSGKIKAAHDWCVASAKSALEQGQSVVVSNTFVKLWELQRYIQLGYPYRIIELLQRWPNIHGVPEDRIKSMAQGWQKLPDSYLKRREALFPRQKGVFMTTKKNNPDPELDGYLRLQQVLKLIPVGKSSWWAGVSVGQFPQSIKLGPGTIVWRKRDIYDLISTLETRQKNQTKH